MEYQPEFLPKSGVYRLRFHMLDDDNQPYVNTRYKIKFPNYQFYEGVTDENGYTSFYFSDKKETVKIILYPNNSNIIEWESEND